MFRKLSGTPPKTTLPAGSIDAHVHLYDSRFAAAPGSIPLPPHPPGAAEYRQVTRWLGIDRVIVTQGNAHGRDNGNLLACLAALGEISRGVAIIDASTRDADMARLSAAGVVGARIMDLPGGAVGLGELADVDARAAAFDMYLGVQLDGTHLLDHFDRLAGLRSRWVLDHHGKFLRGVSVDGPEVAALKRLIDRGNCWFKLAGCYEASVSGPPDYADVAALTAEIARYAPERIVWGTNWPHNRFPSAENYPDDAELLDLVLGWLPDARGRKLALVDNPAELARWR